MASLETLEEIMRRIEKTMDDFIAKSTRATEDLANRVDTLEKKEILRDQELTAVREGMDKVRAKSDRLKWSFGIPMAISISASAVQIVLGYFLHMF